MIETPRLYLRALVEADKPWSASQAADPVVMRHLGGPMSRAASDERIDRMIALQRSHGFSFWRMERKDDGASIGLCGLKLFDAVGATLPGEIEIGWRLARDCWGQGFAKEAAAASLDFAFEMVGAEQVVALTGEANVPSWGLMRRLGMVRRPDLDFLDPRFPDPTILHVITRAGWRGRGAQPPSPAT